ncbi:hypothetical protein AB4305_03275 [Nocardia sp. 2YAB30]|uniref:hypothetical protein n=1 Tax=unclassified Nocardia TaxID=2637762 RepID=UPI003F945668
MPATGPKRSSRTPQHPEVRDRLERSRGRVRARRARARQREQAITAAVKQYLAAWEAIAAREAKRDSDIEALRQQITVLQARAAEEIASHRTQQALAAATIRDQGQTDDDVAELLEITPKQARQLIIAARTATSTDETASRPRDRVEPARSAPAQRDNAEASLARDDDVAGATGGSQVP